VAIGLLGKIAQNEHGKFEFSPAAAICIAEVIKMALSFLFICVESGGSVAAATRKIAGEVSGKFLLLIAVLALMYCYNNQMHFFLLTFIDPGTVFLSRAGATLLVASLQHFFLQRFFSGFQWRMMGVQLVGMVIRILDTNSGVWS